MDIEPAMPKKEEDISVKVENNPLANGTVADVMQQAASNQDSSDNSSVSDLEEYISESESGLFSQSIDAQSPEGPKIVSPSPLNDGKQSESEKKPLRRSIRIKEREDKKKIDDKKKSEVVNLRRSPRIKEKTSGGVSGRDFSSSL